MLVERNFDGSWRHAGIEVSIDLPILFHIIHFSTVPLEAHSPTSQRVYALTFYRYTCPSVESDLFILTGLCPFPHLIRYAVLSL